MIYSRADQRIYFGDKSWECRSDFFPGFNEAGQPHESIPCGEYCGVYAEIANNGVGYGTFYITTGDPRSRDIHGGGSNLPSPFAPYQGWLGTYGCLRMQNADGEELSQLIIDNKNSDTLIVQEEPYYG